MFLLILVVLSLYQVAFSQDQCYCFTGNSVNIRDASCGNVIGSASNGKCYPWRDGSEECVLGSTTNNFVELQFGDQSGWVADEYVSVGNCPGDVEPGVCSSLLEVVDREGWGARPPTSSSPLDTPVDTVFIHHTYGSDCHTKEECIDVMQAIQDYHIDERGWNDIGYNFLVGDDGRAYEGRGFDIHGAHTGPSCNGVSVAVSLMGNFHSDGVEPSQLIMDTVRNIIDCGIQQGHIVPWAQVNILGHKDPCATSCPGDYMYANIQTWPWYGRIPDRCYC